MESSQATFTELERALGSAHSAFDHREQISGSSGEAATIRTSLVSTTLTKFSNSDDDNGLDAVTPYRDIDSASPQKDAVRSIALPPTPPTPEKATDLHPYHTSLRSGLLQADLRSQASGLSSSGLDWRSLPTPDPSPLQTRENLLLPFHMLNQRSSSYADSFETAKEGQSRAESPSSGQISSPARSHTPVAMSKQADMLDRAPLELNDTPIYGQGEELHPVSHPAGVIDEAGQRRRSFFDAAPSTDSAPASPTLVRSLSQGTAQRRLWSVIQPGDAIKRPDQSLLYTSYSSPVVRKRPTTRSREPTRAEDPAHADHVSPGSEMQPVIDKISGETRLQSSPDIETEKPQSPIEMDEVGAGAQSALDDERRPPPSQLGDGGEDTDTNTRALHEKQLTVNAGSADEDLSPPHPGAGEPVSTRNDKVPADDMSGQRPRTPHSVTKSSLEDNNVVYKLIREENVKRHSNISDGSVQAVVVALPEHRRTLRHTPKRHSLRGDVSLTSNSHRSSAESGRKSIKRNTGTTFTASDTDLTSPDISPSLAKATLKAAPVLQLPPGASVEHNSHADERRSPRNASSGANTVILARRSSGSQSTQHHSLRRTNRDHDLGVTDSSHNVHDAHDAHDVRDADDDDDDDDAANDVNDNFDEDDDNALDDFTDPVDLNKDPRVGSPPMHHMSSKPVYVPLADLYSPPRLRRFSNESRLEKNVHVRRTSLDRPTHRTSQPLEVKLEQAAKELTREGHELLDDRHSLALTSTMTSPKRGSFDVNLLRPTHASFSVSQASMPTSVELLEARGVVLYPHNNESLLVVQQGPRHTGNTIDVEIQTTNNADGTVHGGHTRLDTSTHPRASSVDAIGKPKHAVDSPLTNPRAPPEPPTIKFIPPTPSEELEAELTVPQDHQATASMPQRRPSLSQRVRRYSEGLIQPLGFGRFGSLRRQQRQQQQLASSHQRPRASTVSHEQRPTHLSSFWHPRGFWEGVDSEDDDDDEEEEYDEDDPVISGIAILPLGGDTSQHPERAGFAARTSTSLFPRNMSVRMPGFHGTGGFLQGNSLGIDRHGTNNRRPHVRWPSSEEQHRWRIAERRHARARGPPSRPQQEQGRQQQSRHPRRQRSEAPISPSGPVDSTNPPKASETHAKPSLRKPSHGLQIEYVGLRFLRAHLRALRARRADAALERRRELLRSSIGTRVYHDGRYGTS